MNDLFRKIASSVSALAGSSWAFAVAVIFILTWIVTGPIFNFSDSWQLIINTATNIVTLLTPDGKSEALPKLSKTQIAHKILDKIV